MKLIPSAAFLLIIAFFLKFSSASPGDDLEEFDACKFQCEEIVCFQSPAIYAMIGGFNPDWKFNGPPLLYLRLLQWSCADDCDYQCQRKVTSERKDAGEEVLQFHGKWPFIRVLGIQELASTIFSCGNLLVHCIGIKKLLKETISLDGKFRCQYTNVLLTSFITILAWTCSTIFHIRDVLITERLDYFLAGLVVLMSFHLIGSRLFRLYHPKKRILKYAYSFGCLLAYCGHIYRLLTDWLYTYNMRANILCGILQNVCLYCLCFQLYYKYYQTESGETDDKVIRMNHLKYAKDKTLFSSFYTRSPKLYSLYPLLLSFIVTVGMSLEIFDFPPVFFDLIDAHSLWHLVTIFPAYYGWYEWMIWDINENVLPELASIYKKKNN
ncbi:uncharacterized protein PRCAT00003551001 [Priceomyces carsonii]|uniref:uncharacterized protein n=1 Tax=Priceomyces carsonii TaxID=28549 RepID=UPI002ED7D829|nr:unnamed protein product [Priceomyces carsonii]